MTEPTLSMMIFGFMCTVAGLALGIWLGMEWGFQDGYTKGRCDILKQIDGESK